MPRPTAPRPTALQRLVDARRHLSTTSVLLRIRVHDAEVKAMAADVQAMALNDIITKNTDTVTFGLPYKYNYYSTRKGQVVPWIDIARAMVKSRLFKATVVDNKLRVTLKRHSKVKTKTKPSRDSSDEDTDSSDSSLETDSSSSGPSSVSSSDSDS
jgi:hypothetical protein